MKPKENRCKINFNCSFSLKSMCVYFAPKSKGTHICKYEGIYGSCKNKVAQVNALTVKMEKLLTEGE